MLNKIHINHSYNKIPPVFKNNAKIHIAEPLVPDPSPLDIEIAIAKLERCKSPGNYQILAELIQVGVLSLKSTNLLILFGMWKTLWFSGHEFLASIPGATRYSEK
jgi:uncharacterized membrane protein